MDDPSVFQELIPDRFLMSFWEQNIQTDGRSFQQHREISLRRIKESQIIVNHDGNVLQSNCKLVKSDKKISYQSLLENNSNSSLLERIEIEFEEQNNCQYIAMQNLKESFVNNFDILNNIIPKDKNLKIEIKILFNNNNILLGLLYSILLQLFQYIQDNSQLDKEQMFIPIISKGFSKSEDTEKIWFVDPNQNEFKPQKYFPESVMILLLNQNKEQNVLYSLGSGLIVNDFQNLNNILQNINLSDNIQKIFYFINSKDTNVIRLFK